MMRDMTKKQFMQALERHGMKFEGFLGYVNLGVPGKHVAVSVHNAGPKLRDKLAYLLQQRERVEAEDSK